MARFILENEGEDVTVGGSDVDLIGTTAGGEVITITGGNVTLDASFNAGGDTIVLEGEAEDYTAEVVGGRLILSNGTTTVSMPVSPNANAIVFGGDDTRTVRIEDGELMIGDQVVDGETTLEPGEDDGDIIDALASLQAAEQAIADFEEEQEMTSAEIRTEAADTAEALEDARDVRSDAQLQADLTGANADLEAAEEDVAAVDGLEEALADLEEAEAADEAADEASLEADADEAGAEAEFETLNGVTVINNDVDVDEDGDWSGDVTIDDGGVAVTVIEVNADGELVITDEGEDYEGIEDLLAAVQDSEEAENAAEEAQDEVDEAQDEVDLLDTDPSADDEREDIEDFDDAVSDYRSALAAYEANASAPNAAALEAAYDELVAEGVDDEVVDTDVDGNVEASEIAAQQDVVDDEIDEQAEALDDALLAAEAANPLTDDLEDAQADQEAAQEAVDDRNELIAEADAAADTLDQLEELEGDVDDSVEQIEDLGYEAPVNVEGAAETGTDGSDVFLFVEEDGTINGFGEEGDDILFVGEGYSRVDLEDETPGDDEVGAFDELEIFVVQDGDDTLLYIEDESFAGNVDDGSFSGNVITLTDVNAEDVSINADGTITIGEMADTSFA